MRIVRQNSGRVGFLAALTVGAALALGVASPASAAPVWKIDSLSNTTAAAADDPATPAVNEGQVRYHVQITNVGDAATTGDDPTTEEVDESVPYSVTATLPEGLTAVSGAGGLSGPCEVDGLANTITCSDPGTEPLGLFGSSLEVYGRALTFTADVEPTASGVLTASFEVSGGGASNVDTVIDPTRIAADPPPFGLDAFDIRAFRADGGDFTQAGGHPDGLTTWIDFNTYAHPDPNKGDLYPIQAPRDTLAVLPAGFLGNPAVLAQCAMGQLVNGHQTEVTSLCAPQSQVGAVDIKFNSVEGSNVRRIPLFNMVPPTGSPARFGFDFAGTAVLLDARLRSDYSLAVESRSISQGLAVQGVQLDFWGVPSATTHERERTCPGQGPLQESGKFCPSGAAPKPFFRMPTSCPPDPSQEGLEWGMRMDSWPNPGRVDEAGEPDLSDPAWVQDTVESHGLPGYPAAGEDWGSEKGLTGCADVPVKGKLQAQPTSIDTETSTGLNVHVEVPNPGLENPTGIASSDIKAVKVVLPQGMTVNPSQAEGLGACTPAQYESSRLEFHPDGAHGCPSDSKIGTVNVDTPLLNEDIPGNVYIAQPFDNPFNSLLALYVVLEEPQRGVLIKLAGKVETNPVTGQITASFDGLPQLPFSSFDFKFREGSRAPLVTPQACGTYETHAEFNGYSDPAHPISSDSSFQITRGIGGGACPSGGLPPFKPGLLAGTRNNNAGSYSPFDLRLFRTDAEQEFTNFSIKLPPGLVGKLAGIPFCSEAAIAIARDPNRTGAQELATPSCPAASEVGRTLVGAGVGPVLTYAPGKIYLAGPYNGSPLSLVSVTAAKVGPFDLGTVVVRLALRINPETAEVFVDPTGSDPIPHIIDGVTTHIRDIRAYVERPEFTLNPTSCAPTSTASTVLGSGLDFASSADDRPVTVSTRFQAASCASLGFKPALQLSLKGGTKRGKNPALRAVLRPRVGDANARSISVQLPHSEFLAQSHIRTVCTRVQFKAGAGNGAQCPAGSVYGHARAWTPLLAEPLEGPVFLRSSENKLPDLVLALHGLFDFNAIGRIDSVKGGIRNTFDFVPDAPIAKVVLSMRGGKKSLLENSTNLCKAKNRAVAKFTAQNGKVSDFKPVLRAKCPKHVKKHKRHG